MDFEIDLTLSTEAPAELKADLLAIPTFQDELGAVAEIDSRLGAVADIAAADRFLGRRGQILTLRGGEDVGATRVTFIGMGPRNGFTVESVRGFVTSAAAAARGRGVGAFAICLDTLPTDKLDAVVRFAAQGAELAAYRFAHHKTDNADDITTSEITLLGASITEHEDAMKEGRILARAVCRARDWVNEPASVCTPRYLAEQAQTIADTHGLEIQLLEGVEALEDQSMRLISAVARGSDEPPVLIHLTYRGSKPKRKIAFVGKGVTFDSGGYSLKPPAGQLGMHADMAGGAAVLGAALAIAQLEPDHIEAHFIVPAAENLVSGHAYRVNDILESKSGKSVEIVSTDAEGRLLLADALTYATALEVDEVVDIATLTGGCTLLFAGTYAAVFGSNNRLINAFLGAGKRAGEPFWHLPLPSRLRSKLKSNVADLKNSGGRLGSTITAALFLREFVGSTKWIHVDIAGMARVDEAWEHNQKGATGFGVLTLCEFARRQ